MGLNDGLDTKSYEDYRKNAAEIASVGAYLIGTKKAHIVWFQSFQLS